MTSPGRVSSSRITERLRDLATRDPARRFCIHYRQKQSVTITYGGLFDRASVVASRLSAVHCRTGDVVLLFVHHEPEIYALFVGCMLHGAVPSLMPYPNPKQDTALFWKSHRELLFREQPRLLIVTKAIAHDFADNLPEFADRICLAEALTAGFGAPLVSPTISEIAFLQHSSGTTATKKGVMLSHAEVLAQLASYQAAIGLTERDVIASWLPLYHDMGLIACFMLTLVAGAVLVALDPFEWVGAPSSLLEIIERHRATFCWMPNFAFHHIANATRPGRSFDLSSIRAFINCSEPCRPESFDKFLHRFSDCGIRSNQFQICYAMAENVFAVTQTPLSGSPRVIEVDRTAFERDGSVVSGLGPRILSCGTPIEGVEMRIMADDATLLMDGHVGEVVIRSPFLFSGYYGQPEKTERALRNGWYHTGDLGFMHEGELFVTGRKDDLLIAYGRNYYAHEIESIVSRIDGLIPGRCAAFAVPSEMMGTSQIILVVEGWAVEDQTLVGRIRETVLAECGLALNEVVVCAAGWLVKTTSGKVSREANRARYLRLKADSEQL